MSIYIISVSDMGFKVVGVSKAQWSRSMPTVPFIKVYSEKKTVLDIDIDVFNELEGKYFKFSLQANNKESSYIAVTQSLSTFR